MDVDSVPPMLLWKDRKGPSLRRIPIFVLGCPCVCVIIVVSFAYSTQHSKQAARFVKESSLNKRSQFLPEIDMIDCHVRQENLSIRGDPIMLQLPLVPAYALTVHKTQSLSIKHLVLGCAVLSCVPCIVSFFACCIEAARLLRLRCEVSRAVSLKDMSTF